MAMRSLSSAKLAGRTNWGSGACFLTCLAIALVLFLGIPCCAAAEDQNGHGEAARALMDFVSHPPVAVQVTFQRVDLFGKTNVCLARWQTNGFFLQEFKSLHDLNARTDIPVYKAYGGFDGLFWTYTPDMGLSTYQRTPDSYPGEATNGIYVTCRYALDTISGVMNMGIPNQGIGSVMWEGFSFRRTNDLHIRWRGELQLDTNAVPVGMSLLATDLDKSTSYTHQVTFLYSQTNATARLPHRFLDHWLVGSNSRVLMNSYEIFRLRDTNAPLDGSLFGYGGLSLTNNRLWAYTNGKMFISLEGNAKSLKPVRYVLPGSADDPYRGTNRRPVRFITVFLIALMNIVFVGWVVYYRKRNRTD
jgi:hypothetical protein